VIAAVARQGVTAAQAGYAGGPRRRCALVGLACGGDILVVPKTRPTRPVGTRCPRDRLRPDRSEQENCNGKQPKLSARQQRELARMAGTGELTIADLAEVFTISRATVYRTLQRAQAEGIGKTT